MTQAMFDVCGVGNAIVDVLGKADEGFLARHALAKGTMTLVDAARIETLYAAMGPGVEMSGGSAANTLAGLASLGGRGAYIGKVADDQFGRVFAHDLRAIGVDYRSRPVAGAEAPTARCLVLVTADAQRTMQTFLGVSVTLGPDDIDPEAIGGARITYLEGYLFDREPAKAAFVKAAEIAHAAGRKVALTLSDPFCVDRHRAAFQHLVHGHVDIVFANEAEIVSLYEARDFDGAIARLRGQCEIAAVTRSGEGSVVVAGATTHTVSAEPVARVVDTTGAGDLYAAGFLYGLTQGRDLPTCGRIGSIAAAEVIGHYGARPETALARLVAARLR
ncbi:MAG: adenosine kinase [Alphaproteobacteria bacterium]|nr:adenosine kinase [Alphaproteobacteria bacterium]